MVRNRWQKRDFEVDTGGMAGINTFQRQLMVRSVTVPPRFHSLAVVVDI